MLARALFDDDVRLSEADPASFEGSLHPEEEAQITGAIEKRRREFVTGRALVRSILPAFGIADAVLLNGEDRAPIWPEGVVATISHTAGYCGVAVASASEYAALGLDVEQATPLKEGLLRSIAREEERLALEAWPEPERMLVAKTIFSAKEAAYKAQYALSRTYLGFSAMRIDFDRDGGTFSATFTRDAGEAFREGDVLRGRYRVEGGLVACGVAIRAGERA